MGLSFKDPKSKLYDSILLYEPNTYLSVIYNHENHIRKQAHGALNMKNDPLSIRLYPLHSCRNIYLIYLLSVTQMSVIRILSGLFY